MRRQPSIMDHSMMQGEPIECPECGEEGFDVSLSMDKPQDRTIAGGRLISGNNMYPPIVELQFHCSECNTHEYADMTKTDFMWGLVEFFYQYVRVMGDDE